ncbi:hypothetical protein PGB90_005835 [Kerria lacca]
MDEINIELKKNSVSENGMSPLTISTISPDASTTTSDTPTPPNGIHNENWATRYQTIGVCEEHRQLLGTEEESSDKHSSDGEADTVDVWAMTEEQHEYYEAQFKHLQSDVNSLLSGYDARAYFEKSKLPVQDLRKIWQLSDITRDGALSLSEFKIAMHLVVLKRNNIQLPDALPQSLVQTVPITISSPPLTTSELTSSPHLKGKEWTKFADSPTSSLSSPRLKPANFDFLRSSVEKNPKILHPVAVRATPVSDHIVDEVKNDLKKLNSDGQPVTAEVVPIKPIQRPQPKKPTAPGPGAIPPPPQNNSEDLTGVSGPMSLPTITASKKELPPPPPPRPTKTHFRSSSLDLNKLGKCTNSAPSIPPRVSPTTNSPFKINDGQIVSNFQLPNLSQCSYHGAFHVYKRTEKHNTETHDTERKIIVPEICLDEKNRYLRRLCKELQEELNVLREERTALQFKLEKIHSRSPALTHSP